MLLWLSWQAWLTIGVLVGCVVALFREVARPDMVLLGGVGVLLLAQVITPQDAFAGFSNTAVLAVGALFVVAEGVQRTNALGFLDRIIFAQTGRLGTTLPRLMLSTSFLSAFLNNTPIVAMFTPRVQQWAEKLPIPTSKLLIPLSYAAILGGMVTLIGTSTNIVVSGLLEAEGYTGLAMFDLTWIGIPAVLLVTAYFALIGHRLLPDRSADEAAFEKGLEDCLFELRIPEDSPLIGQSVEEAGLRSLIQAYLAHVERRGHLLTAGPEEVLAEGDKLTFVGDPDIIDPLVERTGLRRPIKAVTTSEDHRLPWFEAVIAPSSHLVGKTLKEASFRERYGGVVLAIQRKDEQRMESLGRIPMRAGDLLLIEASEGFDRRWKARRDEFYLVAPSRPQRPRPQPGKAPLALAILGTMVAATALGWMPLVTAAFTAALLVLVTGCVRGREARQAVDLSVLVVIAAALGLGQAVKVTGLADLMAQGIVTLTVGWEVVGVLVVLYVVTNVLTELITHKAAAVLMIPVALSAATALGYDPKAFALVVAVGAAASFMTPIGYQTNLMVMAAGGYRFKDYLKSGLPVSLMVMALTVLIVKMRWLP